MSTLPTQVFVMTMVQVIGFSIVCLLLTFILIELRGKK